MFLVCQKTADRRFLRERHPAQKAQGVLHNKKENTDTVKKEVFDVKLSYLSYFLHMKPIFRMALDLRCSVHGICCGSRLFLPYASDMYGFIKKGMKEKNAGWMV